MPTREDALLYDAAGPALLLSGVLKTAAKFTLNYNDTGLAAENTRSELTSNIIKDAKEDPINHLNIPKDYEALFMQGSSTGEFFWVTRTRAQVAMQPDKLQDDDVVITGLKTAIEKEYKFDYIITVVDMTTPVYLARFPNIAPGTCPRMLRWPTTVIGVEFPAFPKALLPDQFSGGPIVVADMSSNIISRRIHIKNFSVVFFGAQKNLVTLGITGVAAKKSLLAPKISQPAPILLRKLSLPVSPIILQYETFARASSLYDTLSNFDAFIAGQVLKLLSMYLDKVDRQEKVAKAQAQEIYEALDTYPEAFLMVSDKSARSSMNICFRVIKGGDIDAAEKNFLKEAAALNLNGLNGHRGRGGIRVSNYNSITQEAATSIVKCIHRVGSATVP